MREEKSFTKRLTGIIRDARKHGPVLSGKGEWVGESVEVKIEETGEKNNSEGAAIGEITIDTETSIVTKTTMVEEKSQITKSDIDMSNVIVTTEQNSDAVDAENSDNSREELFRIAAILAVIRVSSSRSEAPAQGRDRGTSFAQDHRRVLLGIGNLASARSSRSAWR